MGFNKKLISLLMAVLGIGGSFTCTGLYESTREPNKDSSQQDYMKKNNQRHDS